LVEMPSLAYRFLNQQVAEILTMIQRD